MSVEMIVQLQEARLALPLLDQEQRKALVSRVLRELGALQTDVLKKVNPSKCSWLDDLVVILSASIPRIAVMTDREFQHLLTELEKLLATLDDMGRKSRTHKRNPSKGALMRVLIVQSEPVLAQFVEDVALGEGFEIAGIARNANEALELAPEADIAILDVSRGEQMTGRELANELVNRFEIGVIQLAGDTRVNGNGTPTDDVNVPPSAQKIVDGLRLAAMWRRKRHPVSRSGKLPEKSRGNLQ
jgi:CheY-like chemotaxis protein